MRVASEAAANQKLKPLYSHLTKKIDVVCLYIYTLLHKYIPYFRHNILYS